MPIAVIRAIQTVVVLTGLSLTALSAIANPAIPIPGTEATSERFDYVAIGYIQNRFKDFALPIVGTDSSNAAIIPGETGHPWGVVGVVGTYLGDYAHTELRFGYGVRDDTIEQALTVNIKYWASWFMGLHKQIAPYSKWFVKLGITHFQAKTIRREFRFVNPSVTRPGDSPEFDAEPDTRALKEGLFGNSFDFSWLIGFDLRIFDDWFLQFEYGNMLRDDFSGISVNQAGMLVRYEY